MSVDDVVVHLLQALLSILLLVERDVPVPESLARLPVQDHLRLHYRVALALEHFVQVQIVEGIPGNVPNVDAGTKTLLLLLLIVSATLSIVKVEILEALDQLFSIVEIMVNGLGVRTRGSCMVAGRSCRGMVASCWVLLVESSLLK